MISLNSSKKIEINGTQFIIMPDFYAFLKRLGDADISRVFIEYGGKNYKCKKFFVSFCSGDRKEVIGYDSLGESLSEQHFYKEEFGGVEEIVSQKNISIVDGFVGVNEETGNIGYVFATNKHDLNRDYRGRDFALNAGKSVDNWKTAVREVRTKKLKGNVILKVNDYSKPRYNNIKLALCQGERSWFVNLGGRGAYETLNTILSEFDGREIIKKRPKY